MYCIIILFSYFINNTYVSNYPTRTISLECILIIGKIYKNNDIIKLTKDLLKDNSLYDNNKYITLCNYLLKLFPDCVSTLYIRKQLNNINFMKSVYNNYY